MEGKGVLIAEIIITVILVLMGLGSGEYLWINGARSAVITLGIVGAIFCACSSYRFFMTSAGHPITIVGSIIGIVAILAVVVQIFGWTGFPILGNAKTALIILGAGIIVKGIMGRFHKSICREKGE
ncbi:MAG TPA: hypothetical protein PLZ77_07755 [Lachnospiraceae bacterium]|nr:hypothetical protein [Lachnospiraceae bacterium]HPF29982.1 hypothetical protein [Lachnospiraceae bacterium]